MRSAFHWMVMLAIGALGCSKESSSDTSMQPSTTLPTAGASAGSGAGQAGTAANSGGAGGQVAAAGSGGTGAGAAGSAAGSGSVVDGGAMMPQDDADTLTITMGSFTVPAQSEVFMCQDFDNPFGGSDAAISMVTSDMTPGSHHLHVFYEKGMPASATVKNCENSFEFRSLLFAAGAPHVVQTYPAGMAAKLRGQSGLRLQVHYLNLSDTPKPVTITVKLKTVDPSTVQKWIAELYFNRAFLSVDPGMGRKITTTCTIPANYGPIGLIGGSSHMHRRGVHFIAKTSTGVTLVETDQWDEPPAAVYDTPIMLNPGDQITWTCTYDNETDSPLTFGDSAEKNEMCIFLGRFFSSPDGQHIECQALGPNG